MSEDRRETPFAEREELRGWLKLIPIGAKVSLEVVRGERMLEVTVETEDAVPFR